MILRVNAVSNQAVQGTAMDEGLLGVKGARLWLMIGFIGKIRLNRYVLIPSCTFILQARSQRLLLVSISSE